MNISKRCLRCLLAYADELAFTDGMAQAFFPLFTVANGSNAIW
ncbi:MAG: hypothetical protein RM049_33160 [Nostoc sp. DedQUE04]|nr:hypothetical protein [Nostoc sp. DedQUE04]MDZ8140088.1 hypothetical protein [Nostoc sp. DedQUE04]